MRCLFLVGLAVAIGCGSGENPFAGITPIGADTRGTTAAQGDYRRGPYLAQSSQTEVTIVWRRIGKGSPVIGIGLAPGSIRPVDPELTVRTVSTGPDGLFEGPEGVVQYEARITGLTAGTLFHYAILDGVDLFAGGPGHTFRTHPVTGDRAPFRFWVVGDSGTGGPEQAAVHRAMRERCQGDGRPADFALHVGDIAYPSGTDEQFHAKHFAPYDETLRNTVLWPTIGNHDGRRFGYRAYLDAFVLPTRGECGGQPSGTESYYSFDYANAHFVVLDSTGNDRRPGSTMVRWLREDLEVAKTEWLIAFWHHAPHSKGSHDGDKGIMLKMRSVVLPILEEHGVDLILAGHSHIYERSMLMNGAYVTPVSTVGVILDDGDGDAEGDGVYRKSAGRRPHEGTVYVVAGNGGGEMKRLGTSPVMKRVIDVHGSMLVDIEGDSLTARMIDLAGEVRDRFSIVKQGEVEPKPVVDPARLND